MEVIVGSGERTRKNTVGENGLLGGKDQEQEMGRNIVKNINKIKVCILS